MCIVVGLEKEMEKPGTVKGSVCDKQQKAVPMIVERNLFKHERVRERWGLEGYERKILSFYTLEIYEL